MLGSIWRRVWCGQRIQKRCIAITNMLRLVCYNRKVMTRNTAQIMTGQFSSIRAWSVSLVTHCFRNSTNCLSVTICKSLCLDVCRQHTCNYTRMCVFMQKCILMLVQLHACTHACTCTRARAHTRTHAHMHARIHVHAEAVPSRT